MSAPAASPSPTFFPTAKSVLRVVLVVVAVVLTLFLIYLLRQPLTWIFIAAFLAIALSGPVNFLVAPDAPRLRDRDRLRAAHPHAVRADRPARPADRHAGQQPRAEPAPVRGGGDAVRQRQRAPAPAPGRLRHHRQARGGGRQAARAARRRGRRARRHRRRPRQLDLRRGHDPRALARSSSAAAAASSTPGSASTSPSASSGGTACSSASATRSATTSRARCSRPRRPAS